MTAVAKEFASDETNNYITLHENENYVVMVEEYDEPVQFAGAPYDAAYAVLNRGTDVVEFLTPQLPNAISVAEQLDMALTMKDWEWMRAAQDARTEAAEPEESDES